MSIFRHGNLFQLSFVAKEGVEEYVKKAISNEDSAPEDNFYAVFGVKNEYQELSTFLGKEEHAWCSLSIFLMEDEEWEWVLRIEKDGEVENDVTMPLDTPLINIYLKAMDMMDEFQSSWESELKTA